MLPHEIALAAKESMMETIFPRPFILFLHGGSGQFLACIPLYGSQEKGMKKIVFAKPAEPCARELNTEEILENPSKESFKIGFLSNMLYMIK
jgi:hypothetical protein